MVFIFDYLAGVTVLGAGFTTGLVAVLVTGLTGFTKLIVFSGTQKRVFDPTF